MSSGSSKKIYSRKKFIILCIKGAAVCTLSPFFITNLAEALEPEFMDEPDGIEGFVNRFYRLCLDREPEPEGLKVWVDNLASGKITGAIAAEGFIFSPEFIDRNVSDSEYLEVLYNAFFSRKPKDEDQGKLFWQGELDNGKDRLYVLAGFVNSKEYRELCEKFGITPGTIVLMDSSDLDCEVSAFVARFYQLCLDREPEPEGLKHWAEELTSGKITGAEAAEGFIFSPEFTGKNLSDEEFLTIMYRAFFDREPDEEGKGHWLKDLSNGKGKKEVLAGFVNSEEFKKICKSFGITAGQIVADSPNPPPSSIPVSIIDPGLSFSGDLTPISDPIINLVQHHMAHSTADVYSIHRWHRDGNGWYGIGYNYWIAKDGKIYQGRGQNRGAHAGPNWNYRTLGIGFQGHFDNDAMTDAQVKSGALLNARFLRENNLNISDIVGHRDVTATACPGKNFRMADLKRETEKVLNEYK